MQINPFQDLDWSAIEDPKTVDTLSEDFEFISHIRVVTKSGTEYTDQFGPASLTEVNTHLQNASAVLDLIRENEEGLAQVGHAFVRLSEIESVTVINFYKEPE